MLKTATIAGPNDEYREDLTRVWEPQAYLLVVGMLNPSDADAARNDPTVMALIDFATRWGFGGLRIINEYAFRSPTPKALAAAADPVGPGNPDAVLDALVYAKVTTGWFLGAWGNGGRNDGLIVRTAKSLELSIMCLGLTANGSPKHPLARGVHRIPRDTLPTRWTAPL